MDRELKIDDRIVYTDRAGGRWSGHFRSYERPGLAEVVLDAAQEHGRPPGALRFWVAAECVARAD